MNTPRLFVFIVTLGSFTLAACTPPAPLPTPAPAREVSVSATATLDVPPDEAVLHLSFSSTASNMRTSHAASQKALATFVAAAEQVGIDKSALELAATTDGPNYRWDGSNRIVSYTSTTAVNVKTPDFERVPEIVDLAVAASVTDVDVSYHSTTLPEHKKHARDLALVAAREKAAQLAEGLGAKLGEVRTISEGTTPASPYYRSFANVAQAEQRVSADEPVVLAPGASRLTLTLDATFTLE